MPTELIEEGVVMTVFAEDRQTRPRPGATQGRLCNRPVTVTEDPVGTPWQGEPQNGPNAGEASATAGSMAARSCTT